MDQQQGGRARLAVLHDVHVTIVKPHEPVASVRIAGQVLSHCAASCRLLRRGSIAASLASLAAMTAGALPQPCGSSHFLRLFGQHTGTTFRRYQQWARLLHAVRGMVAGHHLTSCATDAGFASPSHFSDTFHRTFGR